MTRLLTIIFISFSGLALAGTNDAKIMGKTSSGRTELEISVEDISGIFRRVELHIDGSTLSIINEGKSEIRETVIRDEVNGIYVLVLENDSAVFRLWMIPGTEKIHEKGDGIYRSQFAAVIEATDPRKKDKFTFTPRITIGCSLTWSI